MNKKHGTPKKVPIKSEILVPVLVQLYTFHEYESILGTCQSNCNFLFEAAWLQPSHVVASSFCHWKCYLQNITKNKPQHDATTCNNYCTHPLHLSLCGVFTSWPGHFVIKFCYHPLPNLQCVNYGVWRNFKRQPFWGTILLNSKLCINSPINLLGSSHFWGTSHIKKLIHWVFGIFPYGWKNP